MLDLIRNSAICFSLSSPAQFRVAVFSHVR